MIRPARRPIRRHTRKRYCTKCGADKTDRFSDGEKIVGEHCPDCGDRNHEHVLTRLLTWVENRKN